MNLKSWPNVDVSYCKFSTCDDLPHPLARALVLIPNRTFLVRFGGISGSFGRAKIPMARPKEPDMLPKRTKKGAIRYLPYPNSS